MTIPPQCESCRHLDRSRTDAYTCAAYPDGVPQPIAFNEADHRQPQPDDRGIRWEPVAPGATHPMGTLPARHAPA